MAKARLAGPDEGEADIVVARRSIAAEIHGGHHVALALEQIHGRELRAVDIHDDCDLTVEQERGILRGESREELVEHVDEIEAHGREQLDESGKNVAGGDLR